MHRQVADGVREHPISGCWSDRHAVCPCFGPASIHVGARERRGETVRSGPAGVSTSYPFELSPPSRRPVRSRKLRPEAHDPEELSLHRTFFPLHAIDLEDLEASPATGAMKLLDAYVPMNNAPVPRDKAIQASGGYLSSFQLDGRSLLKPGVVLNTRQKLGLTRFYENEFFQGPDYRYTVDDKGLLVDMVRLKKHLPNPFSLLKPTPPDDMSDHDHALSRDLVSDQAKPLPQAALSRRKRQGGFLETPMPDLTPLHGAHISVTSLRDSTAWSFEHSSDPDVYLPELAVSSGPSQSSNSKEKERTKDVPSLSASPFPILNIFPYNTGPKELFNALWDLDLVEKVVWVGNVDEADLVLHRRPGPRELRAFAYDSFRDKAKQKGIPFVTIKSPTVAELRFALIPVFQLYNGEIGPADLQQAKGGKKRRGLRSKTGQIAESGSAMQGAKGRGRLRKLQRRIRL